MIALQELFGKVSLFAIYLVRDEFPEARKHVGDGMHEECYCKGKINYGLPCKHDLLQNGYTVTLKDIPARWHLEYDTGKCIS